MHKLNIFSFFIILFISTQIESKRYRGYKVFSITPESEKHADFLNILRDHYSVDLWREPNIQGHPVLASIKPELVQPVEKVLKSLDMNYSIPHHDLQSLIDQEKVENIPKNYSISESFDFGVYNQYEEIKFLIAELTTKYPKLIREQSIGKTYENRPIHVVKIGSGSPKKKIIIECGIHANEWSGVAVCVYLTDQLVENYGSDPNVTKLLDNYEFNIVLVANPDGYVYTWTNDRMWRKSRSRSRQDPTGTCRGVDINRNFDYDHCGVGTSNDPCKAHFCGDQAFSEGEARALRDLMEILGDSTIAYFAIHSYSQLWMTPYGNKEDLPPNYEKLERVAQAGIDALRSVYKTEYKFGTITRVLYQVTGSSIDYAYVKRKIPYSYAIELRDTGEFGHVLPQKQILPMCIETYKGLIAAFREISL